MNNIIFRGKRKANKEWIEGWLKKSNKGYFYIIPDDIYISTGIINKSIAMYTGLKDNTKWDELTEQEQQNWLINHTKEEWDGKQIFGSIPVDGEMSKGGDILKYNITSKKDGILVAKIPDIFYAEESEMHGFFSNDSKILGNQFDNPELLEDTND